MGGDEGRKRSKHSSSGGRHRSRDKESKKLTDEEERLYEKARAFIEQQQDDEKRRSYRGGDDGSVDSNSRGEDDGRGSRRRKSSQRHGKNRKRRTDDGSESDTRSRDKSSRKHRDHRSERKRRHRSHRDGDDNSDRRKEHKRSRKDDDHNEKSHKKSKHRDDKHEKKKDRDGVSSKRKSSPPDPSTLISLGDIINQPPLDKLDPEINYFSYNSHLRLFLYRSRGVYFEDLTSEEARTAFKKFVDAYNDGKLESAYYDPKGLRQDVLDQCSRTKHQWKFQTSKVEEQKLDMVKNGVRRQTEYDASEGQPASTVVRHARSSRPTVAPRGPAAPPEEYNEHQSQRERAAQRNSDKIHRERIKLANEEMDPHGGKPDSGWARQQEKKRQRADATHGASKDKESQAWGGAELDDDAIYGSAGVGRGGKRGELSYEEALAKERSYRERKESEKAARTAELLKKEEEKQQNMLKMLGLSGLKAGQKITIAPRNEG